MIGGWHVITRRHPQDRWREAAGGLDQAEAHALAAELQADGRAARWARRQSKCSSAAIIDALAVKARTLASMRAAGSVRRGSGRGR